MKNLKGKSILGIALFALAMITAPAITIVSCICALLIPNGGYALGVLNPASIAWNGKEVMAMNEAIFVDTFINPPITEFHTIIPGIVAKQQIAYLGLLGLVGKSGSGCNPTADTPTADLTEKFWLPKPITMRIEECYTTYNASFFVWAQNKGVKRADLTNTDVFNFIIERATTGLDEAKLRHAWFGDVDAANISDSPAGLITDGVDVDYFNAIDGFWKQMYAIVAGDATRRSATIAKNAGVTYLLQKFDAADTTNKVVMGYFQSLREDADTRLSDRDDTIFIVTKSVYDQYVRELKSYTNIEQSYALNINGVRELMYDGVPVRKFTFQDRTIKAYFNNGTVTHQPHRIVYTTKENLQIGVESEAAMNELDVHYDRTLKKNIVDAEWLMDVKVVKDYFIQVAY